MQTENRIVGMVGGRVWWDELREQHYTLPRVRLTACGKLLYNTGSSTQCSVTASRGGMRGGSELRGEGTYVYLRADARCCMAETSTIL